MALLKKRNLFGKEPDATMQLAKLKRELDFLHRGFDMATDPILIDSYIYEIMSVNMKYKFYLKLCKERGLGV